MGPILVIFMYGTNSGPTQLELKQRRSMLKMVVRVSKGEPAKANPEQGLSRTRARVSNVMCAMYEQGNSVCPDSSHKTKGLRHDKVTDEMQ